MSYDVSEGPENELDLGPDDRDQDPPHAPNGDPQTDTDECPECYRDPCECPPDESREAWRWPQDT